MISRELLGTALTPDNKPLELWREPPDNLVVRVNGITLMSSRQHGSEEVLAERALAGLRDVPDARVLVGGLGLGFTLRASLDRLGPDATVVCSELFPAIVEWNRGPLGHLAGHPLRDPRVELDVGDVLHRVSQPDDGFDAIMLDVDNGPEAFTTSTNNRLYGRQGLALLHEALRPGGMLAVWSAFPSPEFERRLRGSGYRVNVAPARARAGKGPRHWLFLARTPGEAQNVA